MYMHWVVRSIDVHALGGQKHTYEGMWHSFPCTDCAYHAAVMEFHPHPMLLNDSFAILIKREYKIGNHFSIQWNRELRFINVNIYEIKKWHSFDESLKESNMIHLSLIKKGY